MTKLTKDDFTEFEDGDYSAPNYPHWICIRRSQGGYYVRVSSSDWHDEDTGRGTTVDSASGFDTLDEALQWGVDCVNEIPLRLACAALEIAFEAMAEWMPHVLPALDTARAEAALAEHAALLREIAEGVSSHSFGADASTRAFVDTFVTRELDRLSGRVRARTTPATLSTDTLAAIAEARGLRLVEPEYLAELEAAAKSETHRTMCEWCGTPATCIVTSEGDPYALACDEHCGHSAEDAGGRAMLSEPGELLALVNALRDRAEDADKHASAAVMAEREACAAIADARSRWACDNRKTLAARDEDIALAAAIRARSKPETQPEQEQLFDDAAGQALR